MTPSPCSVIESRQLQCRFMSLELLQCIQILLVRLETLANFHTFIASVHLDLFFHLSSRKMQCLVPGNALQSVHQSLTVCLGEDCFHQICPYQLLTSLCVVLHFCLISGYMVLKMHMMIQGNDLANHLPDHPGYHELY